MLKNAVKISVLAILVDNPGRLMEGENALHAGRVPVEIHPVPQSGDPCHLTRRECEWDLLAGETRPAGVGIIRVRSCPERHTGLPLAISRQLFFWVYNGCH
jgi:hypothetical protein